MNEDTIQDLKQFIAATVSQQVSDIRSDMQGLHSDMQSLRSDVQGLHSDMQSLRSDIKNLDDKLSLRIDDLSKSVAEAIENTNEATDMQLKNHEHRIVRLERKAA